MKKKRKWLRGILVISLLLIAGFAIFVSIYYPADAVARRYMESDDTVKVEQTKYGWLFDGPSSDSALIFYPGARVEETAYAPLLHELAANGIDVCLVKMPLRLASLGEKAAGGILDDYDYSNWYIGGHSLGGVVASGYASYHPASFSGVILLGSYPLKKLPDSLKELMIIGSEDKILNEERILRSRKYDSIQSVEYIIEGGNHSQFGSYGPQRGDGKSKIAGNIQVEETVNTIVKNLM